MSNLMHMKRRGEAGFNIIGLSMAMIIIGILASAAMYMRPGVREVTDKKTAILLEANVNAVIGYAGMHGRLPAAADYPSLVRSNKDGYGNDTHYVYDETLNAPNAICTADPASVGLVIQEFNLRNVAFAIWSDGQDRKTKPLKPAGAVATARQLEVAKPSAAEDDIMKWVTLEELKDAAQCDGFAQPPA